MGCSFKSYPFQFYTCLCAPRVPSTCVYTTLTSSFLSNLPFEFTLKQITKPINHAWKQNHKKKFLICNSHLSNSHKKPSTLNPLNSHQNEYKKTQKWNQNIWTRLCEFCNRHHNSTQSYFEPMFRCKIMLHPPIQVLSCKTLMSTSQLQCIWWVNTCA